MRKRNHAIDVLKFVATLAIFNHLAAPFYGRYAMLATGGAIGCVLFFFCSGYLIASAGGGDFLPWIKRRICRLWPTCFIAVLFYEAFCGLHFEKSGGGVAYALKGAGWFVPCIVVHYVAWWWVCFKARMNGLVVLAVDIVVSIAFMYVLVPLDSPGLVLFGGINAYFKWVFTYMFFMLGAIVAEREHGLQIRPGVDVVMMVLCLALFYSLYPIAAKSMVLTRIQFVEWFPLMGFAYYAYKVANAGFVLRMFDSKWFSRVVWFVGGLSLEMYLVGGSYVVRHRWTQYPYPYGYMIGFVTAFACAYLVRSAGRLLAQTFDRSLVSYDWRAVFKP